MRRAEPVPRPLRGWRCAVALVWLSAVVGLYLAVREFGVFILR